METLAEDKKEITDEAVYKKVCEYLKGRGEQAYIDFVYGRTADQFFTVELKDIAEFLSQHFPLSFQSVKWTRKIHDILENLYYRGRIYLRKKWSRSELNKTQKIKVIDLREFISLPAVILRKTEKDIAESPVKITIVKNPSLIGKPRGPRRIFHKKGEVRRIREEQEKGDRNETRLFKIAKDWMDRNEAWFAENKIEIEVSQSGKHRPEKGKFNLSDKKGEDVLICFSQDRKNYLLVYNAKSSFPAACAHDKKYQHIKKGIIRREEGTEIYVDGFLKRAFVVNPGKTDEIILQEIYNDAFRISGIHFPL